MFDFFTKLGLLLNPPPERKFKATDLILNPQPVSTPVVNPAPVIVVKTKITNTGQSTLPPLSKPNVVEPVVVRMTVPLYYCTERGPEPWDHSVFCARLFAETVLTTLDKVLAEHNASMVHIGVYNPRMARKKNGKPLDPPRWSNHAYGSAIDFKGVIIDNKFTPIPVMKKTHIELLNTIKNECSNAITKTNHKPEIVDEGDWIHIGIWHS